MAQANLGVILRGNEGAGRVEVGTETLELMAQRERAAGTLEQSRVHRALGGDTGIPDQAARTLQRHRVHLAEQYASVDGGNPVVVVTVDFIGIDQADVRFWSQILPQPE